MDGAIVTPSLVSLPWIRRWPQSGFSFARRTTRRAMLRIAGGRPGSRRLLVSYFPAASLRRQASRVAGVTGKTPAQRPRGISFASAAPRPARRAQRGLVLVRAPGCRLGRRQRGDTRADPAGSRSVPRVSCRDAGADVTGKGSLTMQYTHLGRSGLSVSRLCLGTMNFGPLTSEAHRRGPGSRSG